MDDTAKDYYNSNMVLTIKWLKSSEFIQWAMSI